MSKIVIKHLAPVSQKKWHNLRQPSVLSLHSSLLLSFLFSVIPIAHGQTRSSLPLMPLPAHIRIGVGRFIVNNGFNVVLNGYQEPRLERARVRFLLTMSRETGMALCREVALNKPQFFIETQGPSDPVQQLGEDESYHLVVTSAGAHLRAVNPLGILHGLQTFLQLVQITPQGFSVSVITIDDQPRFPWRGLLIDSGSRFIPIDVLKRNLDGMEAVKLNVFHWFLSDDEGFRAESKIFPRLQEKGSDGLYYSQDQIRDLVSYAHDRGIRVVPEFDVPCHTTSWFAGYPDLASGKGPYKIVHDWYYVSPASMDPASESTYTFLDKFIGEMAALFPDAYFHAGGDECSGKEWNANPRIQEFMRAHAIRDSTALQAYFTGKVQKIIAAHGKIMEGWDEVLQPVTPKDIVIQSWRGQKLLVDAAGRGHSVLRSSGYYLGGRSAADYYAKDPLGEGAATLSNDEKQRVLGGEAAIWNVLDNAENIDSHIWPCAAAIAERLWSSQDVQDVRSMYARLTLVSQKLEYYGLEHNASYPAMLRRMTGNPDPFLLRVLGDVMQPVPYDPQMESGHLNTFTPLNRLCDAVLPESDTARHFLDLVNTIIAGNPPPQDWDKAQHWLRVWRDNDAQLQPLLAKSQLTQELVPVSTNLHRVAEVGLESIIYLQNHRPASAAWRSQQLALLRTLQQPQAGMLDMIAPAVKKLVQATAQ
jgi:hexosaminidase